MLLLSKIITPGALTYCASINLRNCVDGSVYVTNCEGGWGAEFISNVPSLASCQNPARPSQPSRVATQNQNACTRAGSIIQPTNQVLGETIPLTGIGFYLSYFSNRVEGRLDDYKTQFSLDLLSELGNNATITATDEYGTILSTSNQFAGGDNYIFDLNKITPQPSYPAWGAKK